MKPKSVRVAVAALAVLIGGVWAPLAEGRTSASRLSIRMPGNYSSSFGRGGASRVSRESRQRDAEAGRELARAIVERQRQREEDPQVQVLRRETLRAQQDYTAARSDALAEMPDEDRFRLRRIDRRIDEVERELDDARALGELGESQVFDLSVELMKLRQERATIRNSTFEADAGATDALFAWQDAKSALIADREAWEASVATDRELARLRRQAGDAGRRAAETIMQ